MSYIYQYIPKNNPQTWTISTVIYHTKKTVSPQSPFVFTNYSFYYDWLKQQEQILGTCQIDTHVFLEMTHKNFTLRRSHTKHTYPLKKIQKLELQFKRLMFPLLLGGILSPLAALATYHKLVEFWLGTGISIISILLFYQGFRGAYQLSIGFPSYQINLFAEKHSPQLEIFLETAQKFIKK